MLGLQAVLLRSLLLHAGDEELLATLRAALA